MLGGVFGGGGWDDAQVTSPSQQPRPGDDGLRAAMDQVRGARRPGTSTSSPVPAPTEPSHRRFWDVRGKLADDLAQVPIPNAATWPRPLAGLIAGVWAALMSWLVFAGLVLVGWVFAPLGSGTFTDVMRGSGSIWIIADGGVLLWQGARLSLVPLLATLVIVLFQRRAGAWLASAVNIVQPREALGPLSYAVLASASAHALAVASVMNSTLMVPLWRSVLGGAVVGVLGFGWGISRVVGVGVPDALATPLRVVRRLLVGVGLSALIVVMVLAVVHRAAFGEVLGAVAGDGISSLQVLILCAVYLPTIIGWVAALLLGPGFSLGAGTAVSVAGVHLGALPPIPLLALVPESLPARAGGLLVVPAVIAVWATYSAVRSPAWRSVLVTVLAGSVVGGLLALSVAGGIGPGRLVTVGVVWWQVALSCGGWLLFGFAVHAGWTSLRLRLREARKSDAGDAGKLGA